MISAVIVSIIEQAGLGLIKGSTLFAEHGVGDKNVIVATTEVEGIIDNDSKIRKARLSVVLNGYKVNEGWELSETISKLLEETTGLTVEYDIGVIYKIKSIKLINLPIYEFYGKTFSFNFEVFYTLEKQ